MSGPKVIRTVTREELLELAVVQLAIVDQALRRWKVEVADTDEESAKRHRWFLEDRSKIEAEISSGRFDSVEPCATAIVAAIDQDIQRMRDDEYVRQAKIKNQSRSLKFIARSILERCQKSGIKIPQDELSLLQNAERGQAREGDKTASIASQWLDRLALAERQDSAEGVDGLARSLMEGTEVPSAIELLNRFASEYEDPRVVVSDKNIAELRRLGEPQAADRLEQQLAELLGRRMTPGAVNISLALDALGIELATLVKRARLLNAVRSELATEVAIATATNDLAACQLALQSAAEELERGNGDMAREHIKNSAEIRETRCKSRAAHAARKAILDGLKQLGYVVREGMATSWTQNKHLVVQHPKEPGLAVEMTGNYEAGRVQVRMVAVDGIRRGVKNDQEVETEWCGDLQTLQASLARIGSRVDIEQAIPAGVHKLKVVPNQWAIEDAVALQKRQQEMRS